MRDSAPRCYLILFFDLLEKNVVKKQHLIRSKPESPRNIELEMRPPFIQRRNANDDGNGPAQPGIGIPGHTNNTDTRNNKALVHSNKDNKADTRNSPAGRTACSGSSRKRCAAESGLRV